MVEATSPRSFTIAAIGGLLNTLKSKCGVSQAFDPSRGGVPPAFSEFDAIWDTGATNSVITQKVIDACELLPTGIARVQGVLGESESETYLVNIGLPNKVIFHTVRVTKGNFLGADILIGMDIINKGDFAVTNLGGVTKFSFRTPSQVHIDFVEESKKQVQAQRFQHGGIHPANRPKRPKGTKGKKKK